MREELYQITAPHFCAAVVVAGGIVVESAPILRWAYHWPLARLERYCSGKGWAIAYVASRSDS